MIDTGDLRKGLTIEIDGTLYSIVDWEHNKTGPRRRQGQAEAEGRARRPHHRAHVRRRRQVPRAPAWSASRRSTFTPTVTSITS